MTEPGGANYLYDVSCASTSSCMAVGRYFDVNGTEKPMALRWTGSTWTALAVPEPSIYQPSSLTAVSCSGSTCVAGGKSGVGAWSSVYNGSTWKTTVGSGAIVPSDISCSSATSCMAVLQSSPAAASRWNGTSWEVQKLPTVIGGPTLEGISCKGTTCVAVGWYLITGSAKRTLAEVWNGTEWTVQTTPNPAGASHAVLTDVSCNSGACWASGSYTSAAGTRPLSERFDPAPLGSGSWEIDYPNEISGASEQVLSGISCSTVWKCMTVGSYLNATGGRSQSQYVVRS